MYNRSDCTNARSYDQICLKTTVTVVGVCLYVIVILILPFLIERHKWNCEVFEILVSKFSSLR